MFFPALSVYHTLFSVTPFSFSHSPSSFLSLNIHTFSFYLFLPLSPSFLLLLSFSFFPSPSFSLPLPTSTTYPLIYTHLSIPIHYDKPTHSWTESLVVTLIVLFVCLSVCLHPSLYTIGWYGMGWPEYFPRSLPVIPKQHKPVSMVPLIKLCNKPVPPIPP